MPRKSLNPDQHPFFKFEQFHIALGEVSNRTLNYSTSGRGRDRYTLPELGLLWRSAAAGSAANAEVRFELATAFESLLAQDGWLEPPYPTLVTLCPAGFDHLISEPEDGRGGQLANWAARVFADLDALFVIEPAFYLKWPPGHLSRSADGTVLWHVHALVWDLGPLKLRSLLQSRLSKHEAVLPNGRLLGLARSTPEIVLPRLRYLLKLPRRQHRWFMPSVECLDSETGEITRRPTGQILFRKEAIRSRPLQLLLASLARYKIGTLVRASGGLSEVRSQAFALTHKEVMATVRKHTLSAAELTKSLPITF